MSWVNWLPKSRIRTRSVSGACRALRSSRGTPGFGRACWSEQCRSGPRHRRSCGHWHAGDAWCGPAATAAAEALVEPAAGVVAQHPEEDAAAAARGQVRGRGAHQAAADAAVAPVVQHVERLDLAVGRAVWCAGAVRRWRSRRSAAAGPSATEARGVRRAADARASVMGRLARHATGWRGRRRAGCRHRRCARPRRARRRWRPHRRAGRGGCAITPARSSTAPKKPSVPCRSGVSDRYGPGRAAGGRRAAQAWSSGSRRNSG